MQTVAIFALILFAIVGCRNNEVSQTSVVIGVNDLKSIEEFSPWQVSIGKISEDCTGFHIGSGVIATAGHCIDSDTCSPEITFTWYDFEGETRNLITSACTEVISRTENAESDFAFFRVIPPPSATVQLALRSMNSILEEPSKSFQVLSYPRTLPLSSSGPCQLLKQDYGERVLHNCDTTPGSSGAPILDENLNAVAIHNRGSELLNVNSATIISEKMLIGIN